MIANHDKLSAFTTVILVITIVKRMGVGIKQTSFWVSCLSLTDFVLFSSCANRSNNCPQETAERIKGGQVKSK